MNNDTQEWFERIGRLRYADAVWPGENLPVEMIQTHISVILLGKNRVLKLKKPVDFGFLDYTTIEKRRLACQREVELNSRLCPEIYLGTRAIVEDERGFHFSASGEAVDYGVLMKRLPEDRMLDRLAAEGDLTEAVISRIAVRLHEFHQTARRGRDVNAFGSPEAIRFNWDENFKQTQPFVDLTIPAAEFELILGWVQLWLDENERLLRERVKQGHICDGHGDLRSESVCVTNGICIFDCVEFNDRFRCSDVANEAAFLAMDLDACGRPDLGYYFFERYCEIAGDTDLFKLYSFYRCYRAFVRGKVLSFQLGEAELSEDEHRSAKRKAGRYFDIAARSARRLQTPTLILVSGLSGTGKTTVARAIAGELGIRVVSSDAVRKSLFGDKGQPDAYGEGIYSEESRRRTYQLMIERGTAILNEEGNVILDATFRRAVDRETVRKKAKSLGSGWRLIECRLDPDLVRRRMERRAHLKDGLSDATWETYRRQLSDFDSIKPDGMEHLVLDTGEGLSETGRRAADWLRNADPTMGLNT